MKYKLPILTGIILSGFLLFEAQNGYQNLSNFSSLKAQSSATPENNSSLNVGIPVDADGNPTEIPVVPQAAEQGLVDELLTQPAGILKRAIDQLNSESRFQASVRHKIHMFDQQLVGTGHYRQFGNGSIKRLRFELFENSPVNSFDQLILRSGGHDSWSLANGFGRNEVLDIPPHGTLMRDQFLRKTEIEMGKKQMYDNRLVFQRLSWSLQKR